MGLPNFPSPAEGVLPLLVMNIATSVAAVKNMLRSMLQVGGPSRGVAAATNQDFVEEDSKSDDSGDLLASRVSITRYGSLCRNRCFSPDRTRRGCDGNCDYHMRPSIECCVCLCKFQADEEVCELSCKHFFHRGCLEKWLDNQHSTCPLCRSVM
ncbi:probable E3 ubiquitin- ligase XERICO [Olea europaea subsp. europaea]|uniref:Probable E3 ubiquitin- ligase XERICO n=1 Tax=Olea europaea subsp. europaea TaxID=158383 RepID=A0A8S0UJP3_OLEEU|nr:probable E3 ubiquitin- ligase XERICO [Olea europaea subsp. europaea]